MPNENVKIFTDDDQISVCFYIENPEIMDIGEQLSEIDENAYMNGYNWEALLNCYIENNAPELLDTFETDSEAGLYAAYFENTGEGKTNAETLAEIITSLTENTEKLFDFVREYGGEIEWD